MPLDAASTLPQVNEARVVAVGPGRYTQTGEMIPVSVKVGDHVLLPNFGGEDIDIDGTKCVACLTHPCRMFALLHSRILRRCGRGQCIARVRRLLR